MGSLGVLNVGAGDTKLTFDKNNVAETIRAGRIVSDMLARGYALLIEVPDGKGGTTHTRVKRFDPRTNEYIVADFDPGHAQTTDGADHEEGTREAAAAQQENAAEGPAPGKKKRGPKPKFQLRERAVPADSTNGIAVARSAGG